MAFPQRRALYTVAAVSFSTLLFELSQTRILSYIFWNHAVYLTISLALLGFGISGTLVAILRGRRAFDESRILALLCFGLGASSFATLLATARLLPHLQWAPDWSRLLFCYVTYVIPFAFAGAILSICLSSAVLYINQLYASDLVAAGCGCVLFFFLLPRLGAPLLTI